LRLKQISCFASAHTLITTQLSVRNCGEDHYL
jgi:hypothetical protein